MVKLRITALPEDIDRFIENLKKYFRVLSVSGNYANRNSELVRCYVEILSPVSQLTEQTLEQLVGEELEKAYLQSKKEGLI